MKSISNGTSVHKNAQVYFSQLFPAKHSCKARNNLSDNKRRILKDNENANWFWTLALEEKHSSSPESLLNICYKGSKGSLTNNHTFPCNICIFLHSPNFISEKSKFQAMIFLDSLIQQVSIEYLLHARHSSGHWPMARNKRDEVSVFMVLTF